MNGDVLIVFYFSFYRRKERTAESEQFPRARVQRDADVPDQDEAAPPFLEIWRNNLSALSHHFNLYVVACEDALYVYQPQFPSQTLPLKPALVIPLPDSRLGLPGHFHNSKPHAVNNIIIADLGKDEVVLCACDDGDVVAYWTRGIQNAIKRSQEEDAVMGGTTEEMRPMFHQSVGESAWGLAVHKESRKVAVSSNTTEITIFEFALSQEEDKRHTLVDEKGSVRHNAGMQARRRRFGLPRSSAIPEEEPTTPEGVELEQQHTHEEWASPNDNDSPGRTRNVRLTLVDRHVTNIPCIAFCNTPEDVEGEFLVSTDIMGVTVLWDTNTGASISSLMPTPSAALRPQHGHDERRAGWGVLCLDKRAFAKTSSITRAMGNATETVRHQDKVIADISKSRNNVRNTGRWTVEDVMRGTNPLLREADVNDDHGPAALPLADEVELARPRSLPSTGTSSPHTPLPHQDLSSLSMSELVSAANGFTWPMLTMTPRLHNPDPHWSSPRTTVPTDPLLVVNPQTINLLQNANFSADPATSPTTTPFNPVVFINEPLLQELDVAWQAVLDDLDRMNLCHAIPELGVVLLGSPKGRVAVLTLHQLEARPPPSAGRAVPAGDAFPRPAYTMRLDHILPFSTQEQSGQRPPQVMVGLAAGPVQGYLGPKRGLEGPRKWRIMLLYRDHSVLSYEIGRSVVGRAEVLI